jgi:hypothetical protein
VAFRTSAKALPRIGGQGGGKPVKKNFLLFVLSTLLLTIAQLADAQQAGKITRIGFLGCKHCFWYGDPRGSVPARDEQAWMD